MERHRDVWNRNRVLAVDIMIEVWEKDADTVEREAFFGVQIGETRRGWSGIGMSGTGTECWLRT